MNNVIIIVTTDKFEQCFRAYITDKESEGFYVKLHTLEKLGIKETDNIKLKQYIFDNYNTLMPFYLILGGKKIPSFKKESQLKELGVSSADFWYTLDEINKISFFVSRLPFSEIEEFESYFKFVRNINICKIQNILLINGLAKYLKRSEDITAKVSSICNVCLFKCEDYKPADISSFTDKMRDKQIIHFSGHGNKAIWEFTPIKVHYDFGCSDLIPLQAHIISWSCLSGLYDYPGTGCMAEHWLKRGILSFWGSADTSNERFTYFASRCFWDIIYRHKGSICSIGLIYKEMLEDLWSKVSIHPSFEAGCHFYTFFGDPTLQIQIQ